MGRYTFLLRINMVNNAVRSPILSSLKSDRLGLIEQMILLPAIKRNLVKAFNLKKKNNLFIFLYMKHIDSWVCLAMVKLY